MSDRRTKSALRKAFQQSDSKEEILSAHRGLANIAKLVLGEHKKRKPAFHKKVAVKKN